MAESILVQLPANTFKERVGIKLFHEAKNNGIIVLLLCSFIYFLMILESITNHHSLQQFPKSILFSFVVMFVFIFALSSFVALLDSRIHIIQISSPVPDEISILYQDEKNMTHEWISKASDLEWKIVYGGRLRTHKLKISNLATNIKVRQSIEMDWNRKQVNELFKKLNIPTDGN